MIIECDTRQQKQEHIVKEFDKAGIKYIRNKLYCGDYKRVDSPKIIIDTKKNLVEVAGNLCRATEHARIKREINKACDIGCERFIFLIAETKITCIEDVHNWQVPTRKDGTKYTRVNPETLEKIMKTMYEKYGVEFIFCKRAEMGKVIIEILSGVDNNA